jgi:ABC-type branched-subunit amino acid transport system ATPase component
MSDILRTVDLSKRYRRNPALERMNMDVPEGSVYGLVGPNGAGKTTIDPASLRIDFDSAGQWAARALIERGDRVFTRTAQHGAVSEPRPSGSRCALTVKLYACYCGSGRGR